MFRVTMLMFVLVTLTTQYAQACNSPGGTCVTNDDCCPNLCSPTSCSNGVCIGSYCLSYQSQCQLDCQCCPGTYCQQTYPSFGRCTYPGRLASPAVANCSGPVCSLSACDVHHNASCQVCCQTGQSAHCDSSSCTCSCKSPDLAQEGSGSVSISGTTVPYAYATAVISGVVAVLVGTGAVAYACAVCAHRLGYNQMK